ncbi:MAG: DNA polymerase III subunit alpha [bacterium]|nr:DNA polymerase III subunit alpha [bacterium]
METKFTHLHTHSHYSLLDGLAKIDELLSYAKELGMDSLALTDHGVIYGAVEFFQKAKKQNIKPIIGCEVYLALEKMTDRRPNIDDKRFHLVLLVKNEVGYKNLVQLITKAHLEGFYYKPRIDEELLAKHSEGLIAMSACLNGRIPKMILANKLDEAKKIIVKYKEIFGDDFYLEIQHHPGNPEQQKVNDNLIKLSRQFNIPLVATNDIHYLKKEDAEAQDILMLINTGADRDDPERLSLKNDDYSMISPQEMADFFKDVPEAISNTQKIVEKCAFEFKFGEAKLPYFPVPNGKTPEEFLRELVFERVKKKFSEITDEIKNRLEYELGVIEKTGFASYFLIVQDFVNWAKEHRIIVGPGRGSAAGSLVSYCLGITNVDPLKFKLLFERFLNPERISLPDIDLDFTDRRRDEVIEYVKGKYGNENVAQIITFGTMAARAVIRDVGRALKYPYSYCDRIAKLIPMNMSLSESLQKVAEFKQIYETDSEAQILVDFAKKLEGVARHASTHACGVVISREPLTNLTALQNASQIDNSIITQYEMNSIESLGLLKMDFLGLKNLTIIEDALARIYKIRGENIDINNIPLDDPKTFKIFQTAETTGVFQLESGGMKRNLRELKPSIFEDIIAMIALYRPGPMELIPEYIARKNNKKQIEYLHPKLEPILKETYGICIYQEQLLRIAQDLAGFTLGGADVLRKAVGKKIKELLWEQQDKFIQGCINNNISKDVAEQLWQWILPFAKYGFNRSHAASYAMIAFQTAYLKAHYPLEFMASLLTTEAGDLERISVLIKECQKMGINVLPPDINESFRFFSVVPEENRLRFGLFAIKNVGENIVNLILEERKNNGPFGSVEDLVRRVDPKALNKKPLESLIKSGALDKFGDRGIFLENLEKILDFGRQSQKTKSTGQKNLFAGSNNGQASDFNSLKLDKAKQIAKRKKLDWEKELLGLYLSGHPLDDYKAIIQKNATLISEIKKNSPSNAPVKLAGIISGIKKILTKNGKTMLFVQVEDFTDKIEIIAFPSIVERNPLVFVENKIVILRGKVSGRDHEKKVVCEEIQEIIDRGV